MNALLNGSEPIASLMLRLSHISATRILNIANFKVEYIDGFYMMFNGSHYG